MRNVAFLLVGTLLLLIQGNLFRFLGPLMDLPHVGPWLNGATPDLVLPLVLYLAVQDVSTRRGGGLAFALGLLADVFCAAPLGLMTFVSVALWWGARIAGVRLAAQTTLTRVSWAFGFSLLGSAITLMLLAVFGADNLIPVEQARLVLPRAIATALFSPPIFHLAQRLEVSSARSAQRREEGALE